jgi:hypothetical protein
VPGPTPPPSWPVSVAENGDGTVTVRYAYRDGTSANLVVKAKRDGEYDHALLAGFVKDRPPPPPRPKL